MQGLQGVPGPKVRRGHMTGVGQGNRIGVCPWEQKRDSAAEAVGPADPFLKWNRVTCGGHQERIKSYDPLHIHL